MKVFKYGPMPILLDAGLYSLIHVKRDEFKNRGNISHGAGEQKLRCPSSAVSVGLFHSKETTKASPRQYAASLISINSDPCFITCLCSIVSEGFSSEDG
jgi:hypothetical protein